MAVSDTSVARDIHQKDEQDERDDHRGFQQDALDVVDRRLDEGRLPKLNVGRGNAGRQRALNVLQSRLDPAGQRDGIGGRLLLDADDHGRLAVVAGFATFHARRELDAGDLLEEDRLLVADHHDRIAQILEPPGQADIADQVLAAVLIDKPAAGVGTEPRHGLLDLLMGDVERLHGRHVRRHAVLPDLPADRNDLGDARQGQQLRTQHEVRESRGRPSAKRCRRWSARSA